MQLYIYKIVIFTPEQIDTLIKFRFDYKYRILSVEYGII